MKRSVILTSIFILSSHFFVSGRTWRILTSPNVTNWGEWGDFERCPPSTKVIAAQIKTEPWYWYWSPLIDDTAQNSVKFLCGDPSTKAINTSITSSEGEWGRWGSVFHCNGDGYAIGFMTRTEEANRNLDETAQNNLRILCAGSQNGFIQLDGERWGQWTNPRICGPNEYICGLQTQVQEPQGIFKDDTALNNMRVECCDE